MPRLQQNLVLTLRKNLKAFLHLEMGLGRGMPESSDAALKADNRRVDAIRQRLQEQNHRLEQKVASESRLSKELQQEREKRKRVEKALHRQLTGPATEAPQDHPNALPEPDKSVSRQQIFRAMVSSLKPGKMLDLGGGPGNFAIPGAQLGWEVTAVDVRTASRPDAEAESNLKRASIIRSINWVESDVRDFQIERGKYDLICIFGLLHHLELEDQQALLHKCSGTLTLLACRVAPEVVVTEGDYEGYYHREWGETREERDNIPAASWGNEVSFHHTEESLVRMLYDCGFKKVMCMRPPQQPNYTFYTALPVS